MPSSPRLPLFAASLALAFGSVACASAPATRAQPAAPPRPAMAAPAGPVVFPGHLVRGEVDRVLTTQGPPWILRRVLSEEVLRSDGKFAGWRLVGLPEEWKDIDLRPGDVVSRVNDLPLETPDEAWEAWKSVARAAELKITLTRDGAARQLVVPIDGALQNDTATALGRDPGPQRAAAPPANRSIPLGGASAEAGDEEAY